VQNHRPRIKNQFIDPNTGAQIVILAFRVYSEEETRAVAQRYFRAHPTHQLRPGDTLTISSFAHPVNVE
jgi:hypothetical protein